MRTLYAAVITAAFLIQGCSSNPPLTPEQQLQQNVQTLRDAATKTITDKKRLKLVLKISRTLEKTLLDYNRSYAQFARDIASLNREYGTPRSEQQALLDSFGRNREMIMRRVVDIHFELVALTTEAEWKKMVKYELQAFDSVRELQPGQLGAGS